LSTTNFTWLDPGANTGLCGGKPATNRLSYGAAFLQIWVKLLLSAVVKIRIHVRSLKFFSQMRVQKAWKITDIRKWYIHFFFKLISKQLQNGLHPREYLRSLYSYILIQPQRYAELGSN
jgi:hypothetical protein